MSFEDPRFLPNGPKPRYLYRTTSKKSQGYNSIERFTSSAFQADGSSVFLESAHEIRRRMVKHHLEWKTKIDRGYFCSDLISWTNTLLFALQHAIRENQEGCRDIRIYILDTWKLSQLDRRNIYPAPLLINTLGVQTHFSYSTEFLAIGQLKVTGCCYYITLKAILEKYPELRVNPGEPKAGLANAVNRARNRILYSPPEHFTESELSTARSSAEAIHPKFQLHLFLALLSRKKRPEKSALLEDEIKKLITITDKVIVRDWFSEQDTTLAQYTAAEIIQYSKLYEESYAIYNQHLVEDITELTKNLSLTPHYEESIEPYSEEEDSEDDDYAEENLYYSDDEDSAETNNMNDNIIRMIEGDWDF